MPQTTRLLVIRHGETDWNAQRRVQGHSDIALNATGQAQAKRLAAALADEAIAAVYSSDLQRAQATATALALPRGLPVHATALLRERHFGLIEGRTFDDFGALHPEAAQHWRKRTPDWAPPGGGESLLALQARITSAVDALVRPHAGQQIAMVAHGGVLDVLYRAATRLDLQAPRTWEIRNCAINRLLWTPDSGLMIVGWDDAAHLP